MIAVSKDLSYEDHSLFELAVDIFYFSQYRKLDGFFDQKSKYTYCRDEFIRKFKIKYSQRSDEEILNFMNIYLLYETAENSYEKSDFLFDGRIPINRLSCIGPYLQETGDYKYIWLGENMGVGKNHPLFFLFKGK